MHIMKYEVNKDFPHTYNAAGTDYGLIPVFINGEADNLLVKHGDYIVYDDDNKVFIVKEDDFVELR